MYSNKYCCLLKKKKIMDAKLSVYNMFYLKKINILDR